MAAARSSTGLGLEASGVGHDVIHFSAMPWISFTGLTHARHFVLQDSMPKISVGKCFEQNGKLLMPVATYVHHGLADGYHVHQFLQTLEGLLSGSSDSQ
jgi:chloramphenicol O-acetyltransferase type A